MWQVDTERCTWRQLGDRISQIMQALQARGLKRGMALCQLGSNRNHAAPGSCTAQCQRPSACRGRQSGTQDRIDS